MLAKFAHSFTNNSNYKVDPQPGTCKWMHCTHYEFTEYHNHADKPATNPPPSPLHPRITSGWNNNQHTLTYVIVFWPFRPCRLCTHINNDVIRRQNHLWELSVNSLCYVHTQLWYTPTHRELEHMNNAAWMRLVRDPIRQRYVPDCGGNTVWWRLF